MTLVKLFKEKAKVLGHRNPVMFVDAVKAPAEMYNIQDGEVLGLFPYRGGLVSFRMYPLTEAELKAFRS